VRGWDCVAPRHHEQDTVAGEEEEELDVVIAVGTAVCTLEVCTEDTSSGLS